MHAKAIKDWNTLNGDYRQGSEAGAGITQHDLRRTKLLKSLLKHLLSGILILAAVIIAAQLLSKW